MASRLSSVRFPGEPEYRSDLPPLERERKPVGYRAGWQLEERLQGVGVVVLGLVGLLVVYGIYTGALPSGLPPPPPPPKGVLIQVPVVNPAAFFLPVIAVVSVLLIAVGFKRVFDP
ncbi:MAG: hypothetical protein JO020_34830 [Chloroflexi bacterium]|nr:hypothetical protein [Chloroflexota bacterium]MBV9134829.1 hypothetical protein [Chloroflexota bacterium]MBV9899360.1 hypothetical protein [Chloroflexota bacterium]